MHFFSSSRVPHGVTETVYSRADVQTDLSIYAQLTGGFSNDILFCLWWERISACIYNNNNGTRIKT